MRILIVCQENTQVWANNLKSYLSNSGVRSRIHIFANKDHRENELKFLNKADTKIIVIGCPLLARLMPILEEFFYHLPLKKITLWNIDPVPIVYRYLYKYRSVKIIHGSKIDAFLWNKIFHETSTYTNGVYDACNLPKLTNYNLKNFRSKEIAFPINLIWAGHTLESFMYEIKKIKDVKLEKYSRQLNEIVTIPWQQSIVECDLDPQNIRHQRGTLILYKLFRRKQLAKFYSSLKPVGAESQINASKVDLSLQPNSISRKMDIIEQSNKAFLRSEYVFGTSWSSFFHDRTVRAIFAGALVLEEQFSGYGTEFEKNGIDVIRHSKEGASIDPKIFQQEYSEREELFKKQLSCVKNVLERSNFSVFLKI